jgi:hypothetical protein
MSDLATSFILLPQQVISTLSRNRMNTCHNTMEGSKSPTNLSA